ncbi:NAD-dependent epimerase/dehydratase family protein [Syntrophus buswellii]|uniref:NAD-dependent epimerase/dehydratase family protein n=1 Tax=Syntrophus buswellii TaxID=43774 RepID=UPI0038D3A9AD
MPAENWIIDKSEQVLITGATGFIGPSVLEMLLNRGFTNICCLVRSNRNLQILHQVANTSKADVALIQGNLFSQDDCINATRDAAVVYHLAIGSGGKSFPNSFLNAVIPTRNLLEACLLSKSLKRFVNVSSFAVYSNQANRYWRLLDESCPIEEHPELRGDAYGFAKLKQDQLVIDYGNKCGIPYVLVRPSYVYGPGKEAIPGRVGIDTFGIFMHLGGSNKIALTYVDNCAEAIVLAGLVKGIEGETFNIVDDDLPSSRQFLSLYKNHVKRFKSIYIPHAISYVLCYFWEKYAHISNNQLPPVFSRKEWHAYWKKTSYSNEKIKNRLGWQMKVPTKEALQKYFDYCRTRE